MSLFAFLYAVAMLLEALIYGVSVPGFPTLIISVLFFAGVQLISLGVIGEYLGRVYEEVKGRPLFLVAEELGPGPRSPCAPMRARSAGSAGNDGPMLILCADDYALTEGISRAVGELAAARRLSATSVMVTTPHWPAAAARLRVHRGHLAIGLHLNLTLGKPARTHAAAGAEWQVSRTQRCSSPWLSLGIVNSDEIAGEIERQLEAFEKGLGFPPDHIDGHEHMHVLSGIRQPLLDVVSRRYPRSPSL